MKVIGQSTVAEGTPFIHLGYTASTHLEPKSPLFGSGLALLIVGVAVGFSLVFGKNKSGSTTMSFVRRKKIALVAVGAALAVAGGAAAMWLSFVYGRTVNNHPEWITRKNADHILEQVEIFTRDGKAVPADLAAVMGKVAGVDGANTTIKDGWFKEMRLNIEIRGGKQDLCVVSAGRDGEFGTSDDLRYSVDEYRETLRTHSAASRPAATQPVR